MKAEKDKKTGKWLIQYRYTDWQGKRRKSTKRGFATKREAEEWLRNFLITQKADFDMKFEDFWKIYCADMETRLREHTMRTKKYIVELKILPYFGNKRVNDITTADIRQWQNELIKMGYSPTYLKTINNQLSAIFNYAVRYYDLKSNPCAKAGSMGKSKAEEMDFWTGEEFRKFIDSVMNKRLSYMAFMILYWTGMRLGELLALNPKDVDLEKRTISITKSYQRLGKKDVITPPKTSKSKRVITIPEFLAADIKDYMDSLCDDGEIDLELFKYITDSPRIKDIPSRIKNKYCYVINSELIKEMNMLFSSQSMLGYTEKTKSKYDSLIKLISNEDIKLSECEPYNIASLNWLIEKGAIYIEDDVINYNKESLTYNIGSEYAGKYGNLYYYDSTGRMIFQNAGAIDADGNISLNFSHASEYAVVIADYAVTTENADNTATGGIATGDSTPIALYAVLCVMAIALAGIAAVTRKKNV